MTWLPVSEHHDMRGFCHRDEVFVVVRANGVCNQAQMLFIGCPVSEGVANVNAAISPCMREATALGNSRVIN
jgi:hypothetical protein